MLTVLMLAGLAAPALSAAAVSEAQLPVIYIVGKQNSPVYKTD